MGSKMESSDNITDRKYWAKVLKSLNMLMKILEE